MRPDITKYDRIIRIIIAILIGVLYLTGRISEISAIIPGIIVVILMLTWIKVYFPPYTAVKVSTWKKE